MTPSCMRFSNRTQGRSGAVHRSGATALIRLQEKVSVSVGGYGDAGFNVERRLRASQWGCSRSMGRAQRLPVQRPPSRA